MNHRPARRGCQFHKKVGFQPDCAQCRRTLESDERALANYHKQQQEVNDRINETRAAGSAPFSKAILIGAGIIVFLMSLGSCFVAQ